MGTIAETFAETFGKRTQLAALATASARTATPAADATPKVPAEFWLNIGYTVDYIDDEADTVKQRFVSLPIGIPLDTQRLLSTNSRNENFAAFQAARNELLEQIYTVARDLKPGGETMLQLEIQLRRVNGKQPAVKAPTNQFIKQTGPRLRQYERRRSE